MNTDRVIKSNVGLFNAGTWAGGTGRQETISKRGNNIGAVSGSSSVLGYTAESGMSQVHYHVAPVKATGGRPMCRAADADKSGEQTPRKGRSAILPAP